MSIASSQLVVFALATVMVSTNEVGPKPEVDRREEFHSRTLAPSAYAQRAVDALEVVERLQEKTPALQRLLTAAAAAGVPEAQITRAVFEGRLPLSLDDLLAAERESARDGILWNSRFGSLGAVSTVETIFVKSGRSATGKDLLLQGLFVIATDELHKITGGIRIELPPSYESVLSILTLRRPESVPLFEEWLEKINVTFSAAAYFSSHPLMREDYDLLLKRKH